MIDLLKIQARLGHDLRITPLSSDTVSDTHRYKAGETILTKNGRSYYVIMPIWRRYRWAPLSPCYLVETASPVGGIVDDYEVW